MFIVYRSVVLIYPRVNLLEKFYQNMQLKQNRAIIIVKYSVSIIVVFKLS